MIVAERHSRIAAAYKQMAETAIYRPQAPGDGMGHVYLSSEQADDPNRLQAEAVKYASHFIEEEQTRSSWIGYSGWEATRALVYIVEAARSICAREYELAATLVTMAQVEIGWAEGQFKRESDPTP